MSVLGRMARQITARKLRTWVVSISLVPKLGAGTPKSTRSAV